MRLAPPAQCTWMDPEPKKGVDVTEMRQMLAIAARARRRQRTIAVVKTVAAVAVAVGLVVLAAYLWRRFGPA